MKLSRINSYKGPDYPTRDYLREHPELLKYIPKRWRNNKLVLSVLGMVVPIILTCTASNCQPQHHPAGIAPLFIHGEGRAYYGCVAVSPPVILSEDEARQIIQDEANSAGIKFSTPGMVLKDIDLPVTDTNRDLRESKTNKKEVKVDSSGKPTQKKTLFTDGYDKKHKIAYEFVSIKDYNAWETKKGRHGGVVYARDFKSAAEKLRESLTGKEGDTTVAIFYEPSARMNIGAFQNDMKRGIDHDNALLAMNATAWVAEEKELRAQVRDFISWLKAQGVI